MHGHRNPRTSRAHWVVLTVALVGLLGLLLLSGLTSGPLGESVDAPESPRAAGTVPDTVRTGGPIVDASRPSRPGLDVPDGHVVLTFDDGPTRWTARILDILAAHDVKATFFVVGARVAERPDLVMRMYTEGHEVGVHTYTHVNLATVPAWRQRVELDQTQLAIAAATGHTTALMRLPYSTSPASLQPSDWKVLRRAAPYRAVFADLDTGDWARPGVAEIVSGGLPPGRDGAVVSLHDGGGGRVQTVAALGPLIERLKARGYTFDTVTSAIEAPSSWHAATTSERLQGRFVSGVVRASAATAGGLELVAIFLVLLAVVRMLLALTLARRQTPMSPVGAGQLLPVSVVVPAFNEELGVGYAVRSLVASRYPVLEIIVVDDGSTDSTARVVEDLALPGVTLIRRDHAGKAAALEAGIAAARHDVLVFVDADTVVEPRALRALVAPLSDPAVGVVSGDSRVADHGRQLARWQHVDQVTGPNLVRRMSGVLQCLPAVPGAISAFRRETLEAVGGVSDDTLAEETDLTMAASRAGWRVVHTPEARAWTEAPTTLGQHWRQRHRRCFGGLQAMWKHRGAVFEGGTGGRLGRRGLPYLFVFEVVLPLLAPIIDIAVVCSVLFLPSSEIAVAWLAFVGLQFVTAVHGLRLDGEQRVALWSLPMHQLVQRQLRYLVVIQSLASALYGVRMRRQATRRTGSLGSVPDTATIDTLANAAVGAPVNVRVPAEVSRVVDEPARGSRKRRVNTRL